MTFKLGENLPIAPDSLSIKDVLVKVSHIKRRWVRISPIVEPRTSPK